MRVIVETEEITAIGRNKKPIKVGDTVKYVNSDTLGLVAEIKKDEHGKVWALLESTNLWYMDETLELTDIKLREKEEEKKYTEEELEEKFKKEEEYMQSADLSKAGGGGAGG